MAQDPNIRKTLYDRLTSEGFRLPEYAKFDSGMNNPDTRKKLYDALSTQGFGLPDFKTFDGRLAPVQAAQPPMSKEEIATQVGGAPFLRELGKNIQSPFSKFVGDTPIGKQVAGILDIPFNVVAGGAQELSKAREAGGRGDYGEAALRAAVAAGRTGLGTVMMTLPTGQAFLSGGVVLEQASPEASEAVNKVLTPVTTLTEPEGIGEPLAEIADLGVQALLFGGGQRAYTRFKTGKTTTKAAVRPEAKVEQTAKITETPVELPPSFRKKVVAELRKKGIEETRFGKIDELSDADIIRVAEEAKVMTDAPKSEAPVSKGGDMSVRGEANAEQIRRFQKQGKLPFEKSPAITAEKAGNLSLKRFEEPAREGVKTAVSGESLAEVEAQRRGVRTHRTTEQAAKTQIEVVERAKRGEVKQGEAFNAEQLEALDSELNRVAKLTPETAVQELGEVELKNFLKTVHGAHAEAGRALNILGKEVEPGVAENFRGLAKLTKDPELSKALQETINRLEKKERIPPGAWDKIAEWGRNIKLASFSGLVRSTVGNTVSQLFKYPEIIGSSAINRMLSTITGKTRDRFAREAVEDFVGFRSGIKDGLKRAADIIVEKPTALQESIFLQMEIGQQQGSIGGRLGKIVRTPQKLQGAIDAVFRVPSERGAIGRQAVRKAFQGGLEGEAWVKRVQELIEKPTPEMTLAAATDARYLTYQSELGAIGGAINQLRLSHPSLQLPVPFFSTVTNLFKQIVERTPLAPLTPSFQQAFAEAIMKPGERKTAYIHGLERISRRESTPQIGNLSDKVARMATGTTFMVTTGVVLNKIIDGEITGRGPKTKEERDALFRTGWQPQSIRLGDTYISYRGFEPISGWLSILADYNEGYKEEGVADGVWNSTKNVIRNFAENPFLVGIKDVMEALTDPDDASVEKTVAGFATGMVAPTIVQQTARVIDPTVRKPKGVVESVQARIPFASKSLLPRRNVFGEPIVIEKPGTRLGAVSTTTRKADEVETELQRLKLSLGWPSGMYAGVKLTPEQEDKLVETAGKEFKKGLTALVKAPAYQAMTDGMKEGAIRRLQDNIREIQRLILFPDVKKQGMIQRAEKELTGGGIDSAEKERTLQALRRAVGQ